MKYITSIIICLIITASTTAQVKFTQLERSATQWNIPVAKRVVPGISDYVMTYMTLADLIDSTELVLGTRIDSMKMTTNDTLALYTSDGVFKTKIVITHPSDSTVVENDYGTIIVESPANTFGVTVDSSKYTSVYQNSLKQNLITGTSGQTLRFSGTNTLAANSLLYNNGTNIGIGTVAPTSKLHLFTATGGAFHAQTEDPGASCFVLQNTNASFNNSLIYMPVTRAATTAYRFFDARAAGTEQFWIKGNGDFYSKGAFFDATNSAGTSGQVLSSTVTGTDWIDLPAGDITAVTVSAPVTGSSLSGPIPNIAVDTTDATAAALATQFDLLGKQATLVSGTNIKTVNSNSLVGSGNVSVGTVTSITAAAPLTGGAITTSGTIGVDTTATTGSALATQFDISTKVSGSGTDNYIPKFNGTTAIENSIMYDDGTMIGIGNTSPSRTLHVTGEARITDLNTDITPTVILAADANGVLESLALSNLSIPGGTTLKGTGFRVNGTGSFNSGDLNLAYGMSGTYPTWAYSSGDFTFRLPSGSSGQVLKHDGTGWASGTDLGIGTLNGLTGASQSFAVANSGTYFAWNSATTTHTLRLPAGTTGQVLKHDGTSWAAGTDNNTGVSGAGASPRLAFWTGTSTIDDAVSLNWDAATARLSLGWAGTPPRSLSIFGDAQISDLNPASVTVTKLVGADNSGNFKSPTLAAELGFTTGTLGLTNGGVSLSKLVTSTGPNVLGRVPGTSGAPTYNTIGTGIEYNSNQLTATTSHYGFLSDADGSVTSFAINTTPVKVNFDTPLTGLAGTMTVSSTNDNITVTAAGGYEINYGVCISGVASTRQISITIYKNSSSQAPTKKSFFVTSGDEDCASGSHIMVLAANDVIDLQIATSGAETVTLTGPQLSLKRLY